MKKNMKNVLLVTTLLSSLWLVSCGNTDKPTSSNKTSNNTNGLNSSNGNDSNVTHQSSQSSSEDNRKEYKSVFLSARKNTIGEGVKGFEYSYVTEANAGATVSSRLLSLTGKTEGSSKYSTQGDVGFYDEHKNSGALFYDGTKYQIRNSTSLQKLSFNEDGIMKSYKVEEVDASYRYDNSSLAKALFEYSDDDIKSVTKISGNTYKIDTKANATSVVQMVGNLLANPIVKLKFNTHVDNINTSMTVSFDNTFEHLKSYKYEVSLAANAIQGVDLDFSLTYTLNFTKVGEASTITPKTFENIAITTQEQDTYKQEITGALGSYYSKEHSAYNFKVKTGVNFDSSLEINSTFQGYTRRKVAQDKVYFLNDVEIDSDYKNGDVYKSLNVDDIHIRRTRLSNDEVWNIEKKVLTDGTEKIDPYTDNDNDNFYLLKGLYEGFSEFMFIQKDNADYGAVEYSLGVPSTCVEGVLNYFNIALDLDPMYKITNDLKVFGDFNAQSIVLDDASFGITINNGALVGIIFEMQGEYQTKLTGSKDFSYEKHAEFKIDYSLDVTPDGDQFEPFTTVKDAK